MRASTPMRGITRRQPIAFAFTVGSWSGDAPSPTCALLCATAVSRAGGRAAEGAGAGLEPATTTAISRTASERLRRQASDRSSAGAISRPGSEDQGLNRTSGRPVLGRFTGAATLKHSVVAFVCVAGAYTPALVASGA